MKVSLAIINQAIAQGSFFKSELDFKGVADHLLENGGWKGLENSLKTSYAKDQSAEKAARFINAKNTILSGIVSNIF